MLKINRKRLNAADDLYSATVSSDRQPIEALLSGLLETLIFKECKLVRYSKGLLIHIFGKLAAAFVNLAFVLLIGSIYSTQIL